MDANMHRKRHDRHKAARHTQVKPTRMLVVVGWAESGSLMWDINFQVGCSQRLQQVSADTHLPLISSCRKMISTTHTHTSAHNMHYSHTHRPVHPCTPKRHTQKYWENGWVMLFFQTYDFPWVMNQIKFIKQLYMTVNNIAKPGIRISLRALKTKLVLLQAVLN